jgi:hypothetical protein
MIEINCANHVRFLWQMQFPVCRNPPNSGRRSSRPSGKSTSQPIFARRRHPDCRSGALRAAMAYLKKTGGAGQQITLLRQARTRRDGSSDVCRQTCERLSRWRTAYPDTSGGLGLSLTNGSRRGFAGSWPRPDTGQNGSSAVAAAKVFAQQQSQVPAVQRLAAMDVFRLVTELTFHGRGDAKVLCSG